MACGNWPVACDWEVVRWEPAAEEVTDLRSVKTDTERRSEGLDHHGVDSKLALLITFALKMRKVMF